MHIQALRNSAQQRLQRTRGVDPSLPEAVGEEVDWTLISGDSAMAARLAVERDVPSGAATSTRSSFAVAPKSASRILPSSWISRLSA